MPQPEGTQRKRFALLGTLLAVVGVLALLPSPFASAQGGESVETTLTARPEDPDADRIPIENAEIVVFEAVIVDREIESIGAEVGRGASDATGFVSVALPGPGSYAVELDIDTLPEGIELIRADKQQLPVEARLGQPTRVLFNLGEGDAAGAARDKEGDSRWTRAARLLLQGVIFGLIIGLCAIGLSLIYGTTGLVNFALSEQIVFGALIAYFFNSILGISLIPAAMIALVAGGIGGAFLDMGFWRPLRKRGTGLTAMMIISIGLALFFRFFFLFIFGERSRPFDQYAVQTDILFSIGPVNVLPKEFLIIVVASALLVGTALALRMTKMGKAMRAVADSNDLAASTGIDVDRVVTTVWFVGGSLVTAGAVFFGLTSQINWLMGQQLLLLVFAAVTLGGLGTDFGAMVGGLVIGVFTFMATLWVAPELKNVGALFVMIIILMVRPQGIFGRKERIG
jgi:branched-chain amino acid transport system permease protein